MPCKPLKSSTKCIQKKLKIKTKKLLREFRGLRVEVIRLKRLFKKKLKKHSIKVILAYSEFISYRIL